MATIGRKSQSSRSGLFLIEWPLTQTTTGNLRQPVVCKKSTPQIKRQKIEHRSIVEQNEPCSQATTTATGNRTQTNDKPRIECHQGYTSTGDVKCMPRSPPAVTNIFKYLNHDEASWLVEEVNEANKNIFGPEQTAEKLKQEEGELDKKKMSLCALK